MHYYIDHIDIHINRIVEKKIDLNTKLGCLIVTNNIKFIFICLNPPQMFAIIHVEKIRIENGGVVGTTEITTKSKFQCVVNDIELDSGFCKTNVFCWPNDNLNKFAKLAAINRIFYGIFLMQYNVNNYCKRFFEFRN